MFTSSPRLVHWNGLMSLYGCVYFYFSHELTIFQGYLNDQDGGVSAVRTLLSRVRRRSDDILRLKGIKLRGTADRRWSRVCVFTFVPVFSTLTDLNI